MDVWIFAVLIEGTPTGFRVVLEAPTEDDAEIAARLYLASHETPGPADRIDRAAADPWRAMGLPVRVRSVR